MTAHASCQSTTACSPRDMELRDLTTVQYPKLVYPLMKNGIENIHNCCVMVVFCFPCTKLKKIQTSVMVDSVLWSLNMFDNPSSQCETVDTLNTNKQLKRIIWIALFKGKTERDFIFCLHFRTHMNWLTCTNRVYSLSNCDFLHFSNVAAKLQCHQYWWGWLKWWK